MTRPHPDALLAMDTDMAQPDQLRLTLEEADRVAIEASYLQDDHGGSLARWIATILADIRHGKRDRHGRLTR